MVYFNLLNADGKWVGFAPQGKIMSARKRQLEQSVEKLFFL